MKTTFRRGKTFNMKAGNFELEKTFLGVYHKLIYPYRDSRLLFLYYWSRVSVSWINRKILLNPIISIIHSYGNKKMSIAGLVCIFSIDFAIFNRVQNHFCTEFFIVYIYICFYLFCYKTAFEPILLPV